MVTFHLPFLAHFQLPLTLLAEGIEPRHILYFTFDDEPGTVQDLLDMYRDSILEDQFPTGTRIYILLDEVQKCDGWAEQVKRNYDLYPNIKFILSPSPQLANHANLGPKVTKGAV